MCDNRTKVKYSLVCFKNYANKIIYKYLYMYVYIIIYMMHILYNILHIIIVFSVSYLCLSMYTLYFIRRGFVKLFTS